MAARAGLTADRLDRLRLALLRQIELPLGDSTNALEFALALVRSRGGTKRATQPAPPASTATDISLRSTAYETRT